MYIFDNIFVISFSITISLFQIRSEHKTDTEASGSENGEKTPDDHYSFLAIIDIVYTDGSQRSCTGTIIQDNVVITAAHCFSKHDIQAELTASFVVIGTRKMFETGYEQYLPIERVVLHPRRRGWSADLALVTTFAAMASDKPGRVVRLASERTSSPDSDVTVFSWGSCKVIIKPSRGKESYSFEEHETNGHTATLQSNERTQEDDVDLISQRAPKTYNRVKPTQQRLREAKTLTKEKYFTTFPPKPTKILRSYKENYRQYLYPTKSSADLSAIKKEEQVDWKKSKKVVRKHASKFVVAKNRGKASKRMSLYRNNWRRSMGNQKNKLSAETFGFVNTQTCSKLVEKTMPPEFVIKNLNEVFCYANEKFYITEEDSGAPAMRRGRLVAVTVGGVHHDGERVAVGVKIMCFCSWIGEHIPKSGPRLQCCKKCCESKKDDDANLKKHKKKEYSDFDESS